MDLSVKIKQPEGLGLPTTYVPRPVLFFYFLKGQTNPHFLFFFKIENDTLSTFYRFLCQGLLKNQHFNFFLI
jgi:hypothetical protein